MVLTACKKKIVLMIDEVDKSSDNQIFLSFLGLLREKYLKNQQGKEGFIAVSNRIFETHIYDFFLSEMAMDNNVYKAGSAERNQYIVSGMLQMNLVMENAFLRLWCESFFNPMTGI